MRNSNLINEDFMEKCCTIQYLALCYRCRYHSWYEISRHANRWPLTVDQQNAILIPFRASQ